MQAGGKTRRPWNSTRVAEQLGIDYPIIQAPFGGLPSQRQTAAVSNLGGLGSLGAVALGSSAIREVTDEIRSLTGKPFAVNLWVSTADRENANVPPDVIEERLRAFAHYYAELGIERPSKVESKPQNFETQVQAAMDAGAPVLSFVYGVPPSDILKQSRRQAILTIGTATTPEEAVALEQAGVDLIVASGFEGGGHRGSFLRSPTDSLVGGFSLIPLVADAVTVPVVAAGGIADARGLLAALALGAEAVQIGTAFLACADSGASEAYRAAVLGGNPIRTGLTDVFTGRMARAIENRLMDELMNAGGRPLPFPLQHVLTQTLAGPASKQKRADFMTMWAGQSAGLSRCTETVEFMGKLIAEADAFCAGCVTSNGYRGSKSRDNYVRKEV